MLEAVLDINVIVSGTISAQGPPFQILEAWRARKWTLIASAWIIEEVERVLSLPKIARTYRLTSQDLADVVRLLGLRATILPGHLVIPRTARDPDDDLILACAVEGGGGLHRHGGQGPLRSPPPPGNSHRHARCLRPPPGCGPVTLPGAVPASLPQPAVASTSPFLGSVRFGSSGIPEVRKRRAPGE